MLNKDKGIIYQLFELVKEGRTEEIYEIQKLLAKQKEQPEKVKDLPDFEGGLIAFLYEASQKNKKADTELLKEIINDPNVNDETKMYAELADEIAEAKQRRAAIKLTPGQQDDSTVEIG